MPDVDSPEFKYDRLKEAYVHYCKSVHLNKLNVHAMYEAGNVMYRMLVVIMCTPRAFHTFIHICRPPLNVCLAFTLIFDVLFLS